MQGAQAIDAAALAALADVVEAGGGGREDREEASLEQFSALWNGLEQLNPGLSCTKLLQAAAANIAAIAEGLPAICGYKQVAADKSQNRPIVTRVHVPHMANACQRASPAEPVAAASGLSCRPHAVPGGRGCSRAGRAAARADGGGAREPVALRPRLRLPRAKPRRRRGPVRARLVIARCAGGR